MRKYLLLLLLTSCNSKKNDATQAVLSYNPIDILTDKKKFRNYESNLNLNDDYVSLDENKHPISKKLFLEKLLQESYFPLKQVKKDTIFYSLFKIQDSIKTDFHGAIKIFADYALRRENIVGKIFSYKDLIKTTGELIPEDSLKNKYLVVKLWFIGCVPCVAEFPYLNKMVEKNKMNKKINFLSLAFDKNKDLSIFLETNKFYYTTVGNKKSYIKDTLQSFEFPLHLLVEPGGKIIKVTNKAFQIDKLIDKLP